jgi:hypothetical protein
VLNGNGPLIEQAVGFVACGLPTCRPPGSPARLEEMSGSRRVTGTPRRRAGGVDGPCGRYGERDSRATNWASSAATIQPAVFTFFS